jgi:hypothetical protein
MHDTLLVIFTGILAFAVLAQSILFFLLYKIIRQLTAQVDGLSKDLLKHIGRVSAKVEATLSTINSVAEVVKPVVQKLNESADIVHGRVLELNDFLGEVTDKARLEISELQDSVHDAVQRAQEAISVLRDNLLGPIHQINAITRAIRAAMDVLFGKRKKSSSKASIEDEFFL